MARDRLERADWECTATAPGELTGPGDLSQPGLTWWPATVPGTAAGALTDAGHPEAAYRDYDTSDWWFRGRFDVLTAGSCWLEVGGLASVADVWLNGELVLHSENMFRSADVAVRTVEGRNELVIRCAALSPLLGGRRPRPRWKTYMVTHQNLRWFRTSLLGRIPGWASIPAPVGPWRPLALRPSGDPAVSDRHVVASCEGAGGVVDAVVTITGLGGSPPGAGGEQVQLRVGGLSASMECRVEGEALVAKGRVALPEVDRWWPCTHGGQPRYPVDVVVGEVELSLGQVGFRTIEVDRSNGRFALIVNGQPIFSRGAVWFPPDPVHLASPKEETRRRLELAREASMNMVRVPATAMYESEEFFDLCDELGLLVWHDCMFAFSDPPDDEGFEAETEIEVRSVFARWSGHPALAVVCGSQEIEEIATMNGLPPREVQVALTDKLIARWVEELLPGTPYVTSNPSGGSLPFMMDQGVCQYFGVGGYLRSLDDPRLARVRFAVECLALATPPERPTVDWHCGGATRANHDPEWKRGVHHDAGRSWDMEDVRAFYQRLLFGTDPLEERYVDPERALDLGRATNAHLMERVFSEWRRPGSSCDGGLVLALHDLRLGAGWGVVDAIGIPKAPWYALRRVLAPVAVLVTDEGLNGLQAHLMNDTAEAVSTSLTVELFARGELPVERGETTVHLPPRGSSTLDAGALLDGFRDITYAYRFAPPAHDVVALTLRRDDGLALSRAIHLPLGQGRALEPDVGLSAVVHREDGDRWVLDVSTQRFAQWVCIELEDYRPEDSWFHLAPGASHRVALHPTGRVAAGVVAADPAQAADPLSPPRPSPSPRGSVRALNSRASARLVEAAP